MKNSHDTPTGPELPPDLVELDVELSSIVIDERPSFGPELKAELVQAWAARPAPVARFGARHLVAATIAALIFASLTAPQARASLARLLPWHQPSEREVDSAEAPPRPPVDAPVAQPEVALQVPLRFSNRGSSVRVGLAPDLPDPSSGIRFATPENTFPEVIDRAATRRTIQERYPLKLQQAGIGGTITLRLWVGLDGAVDHVQMERGSDVLELNRAALDIAPSLRFRPARRLGIPVGTWVQFDLVFEPTAAEDVELEAPAAIADPAAPENLSFELLPYRRAGESLPPPPTLFEAQQLLREALGAAVDRGGFLQNLAAVLEGEPPPAFGPTEWRRTVGAALELAMVAAPLNPAPVLALARIRRKQGLRSEARRLYGEGIARARANAEAVPATLLAELYYELGKIIQEESLGSADLGRIPASELSNTGCRVPSGDPGARFVTAEQAIGLNNLCPAELSDLMSQKFERVPPKAGNRREDALRSFYAAVEALPSHLGANVEILLDLADQRRWDDLLERSERFMWESQGHLRGVLLSGLALERLGRPEKAIERFKVALEGLPEEESRALTDIQVLMSPARASRYAGLNEAGRESVARSFWKTRDPILTTPVNEREVEHLARASYAALRYGGLESDAAVVWLRYGRPNAVRALGEGTDLRTIFWDYGVGLPDVTFSRPATSSHMDLTPESRVYMDELREVFPQRYNTVALREVRTLPGVISRFRVSGEGVELEIHSAVPEQLTDGRADSLYVSLYVLGTDAEVLSSSRRRIAAVPGDISLRVWAAADAQQVVVELYDEKLGFAAAMRGPVGFENGSVRTPHISDLLLVEAANPKKSDVRRTASWVSPLTEEVSEATLMGALFELYDLPEEGFLYGIQAYLEGGEGSLIPVPIRPAGADEFRTLWRRRADPGHRVTEYLTLDLSGVPKGEYTLRLVTTLPSPIRSAQTSRRLRVR